MIEESHVNEVLTPQEVARRLCRNERTIRRYANRGLMPSFRIGVSPAFLWPDVVKAVKSGALASNFSGSVARLKQRQIGGSKAKSPTETPKPLGAAAKPVRKSPARKNAAPNTQPLPGVNAQRRQSTAPRTASPQPTYP